MKHQLNQVIITFDYEGAWGMPFSAPYDQLATTQRLIEVLDGAGAKAVFFVTGKLVSEHPECIRLIHEHGHEVGVHGVEHEHMHELSAEGIEQLRGQLELISQQIEALVGYRPRGFRSPYLMGPVFYRTDVYQMLADLGYTWISNREIRMPEEVARPDRLAFLRWPLAVPALRQLALILLNLTLLRTERPFGTSRLGVVSWLLTNPRPYPRPEGLMEYPLTSPLDCDMLSFPNPNSQTETAVVDYTKRTILTCSRFAGDTLTINCHDWITGTTNRASILAGTLAVLNRQKVRYALPGRDTK